MKKGKSSKIKMPKEEVKRNIIYSEYTASNRTNYRHFDRAESVSSQNSKDSDSSYSSDRAKTSKKKRQFFESQIKNEIDALSQHCHNLQENELTMKTKIKNLHLQNRDLLNHNQKTQYEIRDLRAEVDALINEVEGPLANKLRSEHLKSHAMNARLAGAKRVFEANGEERTKEIHGMRETLSSTCQELNDVRQHNNELAETCSQLSLHIESMSKTVEKTQEDEDIVFKNLSRIVLDKTIEIAKLKKYQVGGVESNSPTERINERENGGYEIDSDSSDASIRWLTDTDWLGEFRNEDKITRKQRKGRP